MKLFTNGCSFTWGAEIVENELGIIYNDDINDHRQFREKNVWSYKLHEKLKTKELFNYSMGSGSNQRIVRTTLDFFIDKIQNKENVKDYIAVIQWTEPSRYELYDEEVNAYLCITNTGIVAHNSTISDNRKHYLQKKFLEHERNFYDDYAVQLITLSSFFQLHNIKYLFCTMFPYKTPGGYYVALNWLTNLPRFSYIGNRVKDPSLYYEGGHPNLKGHEEIAERIYNRLKQFYNL